MHRDTGNMEVLEKRIGHPEQKNSGSKPLLQ